MKPRRRVGLLALVGAGLACGNLLSPPPPMVDFGEWRALVIHSDDWGLEGWFPEDISDSLRVRLTEGVPHWQRAYLYSTLESAEEVRQLARLFSTLHDLDGLPLVLQANTIVAGPSVRAHEPSGPGWPVHPSGAGPDYRRPDLVRAVDEAIAAGVWWPELHGLTHYDLWRYAEVRASGEPLADRAARQGVFAYQGYRRDHELGHPDVDRAEQLARESVARFSDRFGRPPASMIAPDYRWTDEDEAAWNRVGIAVVQAKREQVDPTIALHTRLGRLRKWLGRKWFALRSPLFAVERTVDLEPYGDLDPRSVQGALAALGKIEEAFDDSRPAVASIHRVQLVSTRAEFAEAGREQLVDLLRRLDQNGGVRFLVDDEVRQLALQGWSVHRRGDRVIMRNWTDRPAWVRLDSGELHEIPARTSAAVGNSRTGYKKSRN